MNHSARGVAMSIAGRLEVVDDRSGPKYISGFSMQSSIWSWT